MSLYDNALQIAKEYTGIAAEEYLARRCKRLGLLDPQQLKLEQFDRLAEGIDVTAEAYMSKERAQAFKAAILGLKGSEIS